MEEVAEAKPNENKPTTRDISSASHVKIDQKKVVKIEDSKLQKQSTSTLSLTNKIISPKNEVVDLEQEDLKELKKPKPEEKKPIFNFLGKIIRAKSEISDESDVSSVKEEDQVQSASEEEDGSEIDDNDGYLSDIFPLEAVKPDLNEVGKMDKTIEYFHVILSSSIIL